MKIEPSPIAFYINKDIISKINYLRKLLLIYRILHHDDIIEEVPLNIDGRALELTSPQIYLFSSDTLVSKEEGKRVLHKKVLPTLSKFLREKGEISEKTIEGVVYHGLQELFEESIAKRTHWTSTMNLEPYTH